jgi:hypothetical protein
MKKRAVLVRALLRAIEPPRRDLSGSGDYADVKLISALGSARNALRPPEKENVGRLQVQVQEAAAVGERRQDSRGRPAKNRPRKIDRLTSRDLHGAAIVPAFIHAELWPFRIPANPDVRPNGFTADFNNSGRSADARCCGDLKNVAAESFTSRLTVVHF